ncbi:hypothetical protein ABEG63_14910 [Chryseobacterium sp. C39-AII1]|uniref:hypothetical protein n=1 Tax=Chryseobacterium sp. C39-AII1 TaxID=3080332 RepID=UPI00320971F8
MNYFNFFQLSNNFIITLFLERPFLGEDLYLSLTIYNKFLGRAVYLMQVGFDNKSIKHWAQDKALQEMLKRFLPEHQVNAIINSELNRHDVMCFVFENKIIEQINDIISGKIASTSSLAQIKIMKEVIKNQDNIKAT